MGKLTFSDIDGRGAATPEAVFFNLHIDRPEIPVMVSREALEDLAAQRGIRIDNLAGGLVEFATSMQPELAATAYRKLQMQETVQILAGDVIR